jgi:aspartokinase
MEVQKYVDGFRSADPRIIKSGTKVIPNLDYATAIESISSNGADAKLLNEQSLRGKVQLA